MAKITISGPIVQVAIDVLTVEDALRVAEDAVEAGVDWLEAGTPLVTFEGVRCIGELARRFPHMPVLADYKTMDGARKYVLETQKQGGHLSTVCAVASDATVRSAITAGIDSGTCVVADLYACPDPAARAVEMEALGIDAVYVHWGSDQRVEQPDRDPLLDVARTVERVRVPVGTATFNAGDAVRALKLGAQILAIGFPLIGQPNRRELLKEYVDRVKSAA